MKKINKEDNKKKRREGSTSPSIQHIRVVTVGRPLLSFRIKKKKISNWGERRGGVLEEIEVVNIFDGGAIMS